MRRNWSFWEKKSFRRVAKRNPTKVRRSLPFPFRIYTFLSMWPLRIQPWASAESRGERGRWWWLLQRDEATGIGNRWKRNADWKSAAVPSAEGASARKLGPGENNTSRGGWRNEDGRQSFSAPRARNMLITFGHRRRRPSPASDCVEYYNAGIFV